jgi:hypothetical protein
VVASRKARSKRLPSASSHLPSTTAGVVTSGNTGAGWGASACSEVSLHSVSRGASWNGIPMSPRVP